MAHDKRKLIARDISWLSFNARVLQEAADASVPLRERLRFLGIFSNNMDEFFRVRVAALRRMIQLGSKAKMHLENNPQQIIDCLLYTSDAADERSSVDLGGRRIIKKKKKKRVQGHQSL